MIYLPAFKKALIWTLLTFVLALIVAGFGEIIYYAVINQSFQKTYHFWESITEPEKLLEYSWVILSALFVEFIVAVRKSTKAQIDVIFSLMIMFVLLCCITEYSFHRIYHEREEEKILMGNLRALTNLDAVYVSDTMAILKSENKGAATASESDHIDYLKGNLPDMKARINTMMEHIHNLKTKNLDSLYNTDMSEIDANTEDVSLKLSWIARGKITMVISLLLTLIVRMRINLIEEH